MSFPLPPVYPITPDALHGHALLAWVEELLSAGCRFLQVRRKSGSDAERLEELKIILALARESGARVVVNDRPDLCLLAGADGVHLGQEDLPADDVRRFLPSGAIIGASTHTLKQFEEAAALPVDYLALGPVYGTTSKANASPAVPVAGQELALKGARHPVVAIGGITPANARALFERGFSSVAVISCLAGSPAAAFKALLAAAL